MPYKYSGVYEILNTMGGGGCWGRNKKRWAVLGGKECTSD